MKIKIKPDKEKAKAIRKALKERRDFVNEDENNKYPSVLCENYYEIIKELATAIFLLRGEKFIGQYAHKELIEGLGSLFNLELSNLSFLQDLRSRRNGSMYYGQPFNETYLENHLNQVLDIIKKLDSYLNGELKEDEK